MPNSHTYSTPLIPIAAPLGAAEDLPGYRWFETTVSIPSVQPFRQVRILFPDSDQCFASGTSEQLALASALRRQIYDRKFPRDFLGAIPADAEFRSHVRPGSTFVEHQVVVKGRVVGSADLKDRACARAAVVLAGLQPVSELSFDQFSSTVFTLATESGIGKRSMPSVFTGTGDIQLQTISEITAILGGVLHENSMSQALVLEKTSELKKSLITTILNRPSDVDMAFAPIEVKLPPLDAEDRSDASLRINLVLHSPRWSRELVVRKMYECLVGSDPSDPMVDATSRVSPAGG